MNLSTPTVIGLLFVLALLVLPRVHLAWLRRQGVCPPAGKATPEDVLRLVASGRIADAMRCHREIHGGSLKAAKEAITAMQAAATVRP